MARTGWRFTAALAAVLTLADCAQSAGGRAPATPAVELLGEWELVDGSTGDAPVPVPTGARATIAFDDGEAGGTSFCNRYSGTFLLSGSSLSFDDFAVTEMACADPELMAAEAAYLRALGSVDTAAVEGEEVLLTGQRTALRYQRVPVAPVSDVVGTRWVLETLIEQDVASSTVGGPAVLVLAADGTVEASTGCRTLRGTWDTEAGRIVVPSTALEGTCSAELAAQDGHVLEALGSAFEVRVNGDLLTVTGKGRLGLLYRAAP
jgi:heat shock protein HslJ